MWSLHSSLRSSCFQNKVLNVFLSPKLCLPCFFGLEHSFSKVRFPLELNLNVIFFFFWEASWLIVTMICHLALYWEIAIFCMHVLHFYACPPPSSSLLGNSYFLYVCPPPSVNHLMMFHGSLVIQVLQLLQLQKHQRLIYTVASALSCVQLCDLTDYILPGSSVHGILQARTLDWVAISFSQVSSQPRD